MVNVKKHITSLTLKWARTTLWDSCVESINPLRYDLSDIYDALVEMSLDKSRENVAVYKSKSLADTICTFKFVWNAVLWHENLTNINTTSNLEYTRLY